jgi:periplasmic divalent cation tolerance protein
VTAPPADPPGAERPVRIVYCAAPSRAVAERLAEGSVARRLAACANFWPIRSVYWWGGAVERADEHALVFKTSPKKLGSLFRYVVRHHPYEVPDLFELQVPRVHEPFVRWLLDAIDPASRSALDRAPARLTPRGARRARGARRPPRTRARPPRR